MASGARASGADGPGTLARLVAARSRGVHPSKGKAPPVCGAACLGSPRRDRQFGGRCLDVASPHRVDLIRSDHPHHQVDHDRDGRRDRPPAGIARYCPSPSPSNSAAACCVSSRSESASRNCLAAMAPAHHALVRSGQNSLRQVHGVLKDPADVSYVANLVNARAPVLLRQRAARRAKVQRGQHRVMIFPDRGSIPRPANSWTKTVNNCGKLVNL
jgi:hypothetical protein